MKIRLLSDLHFEHMADDGKSFVASLDSSGCDVLVVAGDLTMQSHGILSAITLLCKRFPRVIYVPGNHEFYAADRGKVNAALRKSQDRNPNLHILENDVLLLDGRRILGTTLWFPKTKRALELAGTWSDFSSIVGFAKWVYDENQKCVTFLRRELREGDIVVTHYLPSWFSVHPKWASESTNCFYVCDLEELIRERKPALWMHGHTHESTDHTIDVTRVVCNPFGYVDMNMLNPKFDENLTIEV